MYVLIYDIHHYLGVIGRLAKLESVEFVAWEPFDYPASVGAASSPDSDEAKDMPPLSGVTVLEELNLLQCLAHPLSANLNRVKSIAPEHPTVAPKDRKNPGTLSTIPAIGVSGVDRSSGRMLQVGGRKKTTHNQTQ
jgi:hypothetical protein